MIGAQGRVPVFAYRRPVDLRKGFEGLSALVQQALGRDPLSGALYLFTNRRRTTAKVLQFDGPGLTLYIKRLARGRFAALWEDDEATTLSLSRPELELFLQGSQLVGWRAVDDPRDGSGHGQHLRQRRGVDVAAQPHHRTADLELDHAGLLRQRRHELLRHLHKPELTDCGAIRHLRPRRPRLQLPPPSGERVGGRADSCRVRQACDPKRLIFIDESGSHIGMTPTLRLPVGGR